MSISIMSLRKAIRLAPCHTDWDLVSILDAAPEAETVPGLGSLRQYRSLLRVRFDDVSEPSVSRAGFRPPTRNDIEDIVGWCRDKDLEHLAVHCTEGRRRSPAVAFVVACSHGMPPAEAFDRLVVPGVHRPNPLIISLGRTATANM